MKKNYLLLLLITVLMGLKAYSTTYTSAQNGNWMDFMTWSPLGVPLPGDIVVINHAVAMDTSFAYTTGSITVNSGGSLINDSYGRDMWLNGVNASFTNNGTTTLRNLLLSNGSFSNSGDFNVKSIANYITLNNTSTGVFGGVDSLVNFGTFNNNGAINIMTFYNDDTFNNYGAIFGLVTVVDSMYNNGTFLNETGAILYADSCTNASTFTNNGVSHFFQFTNVGTYNNNNYTSFNDMTNIGTFTNIDSLIGAGSITNIGVLNNQAGARIDLAFSFLNVDTVNFNATLTADGRFVIGDSFYNFNIISGSSLGSIQVQDSSYNSGTMAGSFDFCDDTPPGSSPYIDINLGTVDPLITYCTNVGVNENELLDFTIYPNPTTSLINIGITNQFIEVYNIEGKKVIDEYSNQVNLENYQSGIYYIVVKDESGNPLFKEKVVKN